MFLSKMHDKVNVVRINFAKRNSMSPERPQPWKIDKKENMPEWRKQEETKRPVEEEKNWELPEKLYREPTMAQLFELFADGELPLQHHTTAPDSDVEENSVGTFWFGRPAFLAHGNYGRILIETQPEHWPEEPKFLQKSQMEYLKGHKPEPANSWEPRWATPDNRKVHTEDEYHIGNSIPIYAITAYVPKNIKEKAREYVRAAKQLLANKKVDPNDALWFGEDIKTIMYNTDSAVDKSKLDAAADYPKLYEIPEEIAKKLYGIKKEKQPAIAIELTDEKKAIIKKFMGFYQWLSDQETLEDHREELDIDPLFSKSSY